MILRARPLPDRLKDRQPNVSGLRPPSAAVRQLPFPLPVSSWVVMKGASHPKPYMTRTPAYVMRKLARGLKFAFDGIRSEVV